MQVDTTHRELLTKGVERSGRFGVSIPNQIFIMKILRDTLYSDKVLAVIREYSSNAWDEHRECGRGDVPIKVHIPTALDQTYRVRDFGRGLSEERVFETYTQFGDSTKRESDDAVGMFGIGSKSGFAYSESWSITSWYEGTKTIYSAVIGEDDCGLMLKMYEGPSDEPTGIEISVPVRQADIHTFRKTAQKFYRFMTPQPDINVEVQQEERQDTPYGYFGSRRHGGWTAVMGCVPYKLNTTHIMKELEDLGIWELVSKLSGGLFFDIGEVHVTGSREDLEYNDKTKKAVAAKMEGMVENYLQDIIKKLDDEETSDWDKVQSAYKVHHTMGLMLPAKYEDYFCTKFLLYGHTKDSPAKGLSFNKNPPTEVQKPVAFVTGTSQKPKSSLANAIFELPYGKVILYDTPDKRIHGYSFPFQALVVRPQEGHSLEDAEKELRMVFDRAGLGGMEPTRASTLNWKALSPRRSSRGPGPRGGYSNQKHRKRFFKILHHPSTEAPFSSNWTTVDRVPEEEDVFVVLSHFKAVGHDYRGWERASGSDFYANIQRDIKVFATLGLPFPIIYGYKTTAKKPVKASDCQGTEYKVWRDQYLRKNIPPQFKEHFHTWKWDRLGLTTLREDLYDSAVVAREHLTFKTAKDLLRSKLGRKHQVTDFFYRKTAAMKTLDEADKDLARNEFMTVREVIPLLSGFLQTKRVPLAKKKLWAILKQYPLFQHGGPGVSVFARPSCNGSDLEIIDHWIEYIRLVDRDSEAK